MEKNFIIRLTHYVYKADERLHFRETIKFVTFRSFSRFIDLICHDPNYMYEYFITSTSTPSCPFVRWSKQTRKPVGYKGMLRNLVWTDEDKKFDMNTLV